MTRTEAVAFNHHNYGFSCEVHSKVATFHEAATRLGVETTQVRGLELRRKGGIILTSQPG